MCRFLFWKKNRFNRSRIAERKMIKFYSIYFKNEHSTLNWPLSQLQPLACNQFGLYMSMKLHFPNKTKESTNPFPFISIHRLGGRCNQILINYNSWYTVDFFFVWHAWFQLLLMKKKRMQCYLNIRPILIILLLFFFLGLTVCSFILYNTL